MTALLEKLIPILLIMMVGWFLRKRRILSKEMVDELKVIIINVALPCILFLSFAGMTLDPRYILVVLIVIAMLTVFYSVGFLLKRRIPAVFGSIFTPWFMTEYEFGMIGIGLFTAIWGIDKLPLFMLIGLGHEIYAWFVCIPYIQRKNSGAVKLRKTLINFAKTPVIIGIFGGIFANISGLYDLVGRYFWGKSLFSAMSTISGITVPLILIIVGYSLVLERGNARKIALFSIVKLSLVLSVGTAALILIKTLVGPIDPLFTTAFYAFVILPPSYLIPVLVKDNEEERHFFSQAVVYYTLLTFIGYIILMLI